MAASFTRRELGALALASTLAQAQNPPPAAGPTEDESAQVHQRMKLNATRMSAVELPITVEPAFLFKP
jgi:hypothetical protein